MWKAYSTHIQKLVGFLLWMDGLMNERVHLRHVYILSLLDAVFETQWFACRALPMIAVKIPKAAVLQPAAVTVEAIHLKFPHRWTDLTASANWISSSGAPVLCAGTLQNLIPLTPPFRTICCFKKGCAKNCLWSEQSLLVIPVICQMHDSCCSWQVFENGTPLIMGYKEV